MQHCLSMVILINNISFFYTARGREDDAAINAIPLHVAAWNNNVISVKCLLESSAFVNEKDNNGNTALHHAAFNNSFNTMEMLLNHQASVNSKNNSGHTALHNAAGNNHIEDFTKIWCFNPRKRRIQRNSFSLSSI